MLSFFRVSTVNTSWAFAKATANRRHDVIDAILIISDLLLFIERANRSFQMPLRYTIARDIPLPLCILCNIFRVFAYALAIRLTQ